MKFGVLKLLWLKAGAVWCLKLLIICNLKVTDYVKITMSKM